MKKQFFFLLYFLCINVLLGQSITFEKTYQYFPTNQDDAKQVLNTTDGGYLVRTVTGYISSFNPIFAGLVKLDMMGNMQWQIHTALPIDTRIDYCLETLNHCYILAGIIPTDTSGVGNYNIWLIKIDSTGQFLWDKIIPSQNWVNQITDVIQLKNGSLFITTDGYGKSNILVTDSAANLLHWNSYNTIGQITELAFINDSTLRANAGRDTTQNRFYWSYINISKNGIILSNKLWNYYLDSLNLNSGRVNSSGSTYSLGIRKNAQGIWDDRVIAIIDSNGILSSIRKLNLDYTFQSIGSFKICKDYGLILAGGIYAPNPNLGTSWLYKLDNNGDSLWFKYIANTQNFGATFFDVNQTSDSGFIGVGGVIPGTTEVPYVVKTDKDGNVFNLLAVKDKFVSAENLNLFPNPASEQATLHCIGYTQGSNLTITDLYGKIMGRYVLSAESALNNDSFISINLQYISAGFYFCNINDSNGTVASKKLVIVK